MHYYAMVNIAENVIVYGLVGCDFLFVVIIVKEIFIKDFFVFRFAYTRVS